MKKNVFLWMLLTLCTAACCLIPLQAEAVLRPVAPDQVGEEEAEAPQPEEQPIRILVNGISIDFDVPPFIKEGRTMVPVRFVSQELGARVSWDGDERKVTIVKGDIQVELIIGEKTVWINGEEQRDLLDVPAEIVKGRTMVPLRFVGETLEARVGWDGAKRIVTVGTPMEITLYFADQEAQYLLPETREVWGVSERDPEAMSMRIFEELLRGPTEPHLRPTIHDSGTKNIVIILTGELRSTGTLIVNLTGDFVREQKARGLGSAGETMAVYSMIHSLCEQPDVERVKFLEEGRDPEAIFGHIATDRPLQPNPALLQTVAP